MPTLIYKIATRPEWDAAQTLSRYEGSGDDARDGFIHFSTREQLAGTVAKHFAGQSDLVLVAVDADVLGDSLKWEPSRGGELFPHLYGPLPLETVIGVADLALDAQGGHEVAGALQWLDGRAEAGNVSSEAPEEALDEGVLDEGGLDQGALDEGALDEGGPKTPQGLAP